MRLGERETARDRPRVSVSLRSPVYVGVGSNLGDRWANLQAAIEKLRSEPGVRVVRRSIVFETEPVGVADQPWFLNGVLELETDLTPRELLMVLKRIERELGRLPNRPWGERTIDLDLLLYGDQVIAEPELVIPHPRMWERAFVLLPLAELAPHMRTPDGRGIQQAAAELRDAQSIRPRLRQNGR
jgi:2-amino-4-hydroxy-6-hydroxymethyldihydropteridine diphosphokinase